MTRPITVILADDHALVRRTLRERLEIEPDLSVVADVSDAEQALAEVKRLRPRIALLDIDMPGPLPFEVARIINTHFPETRVIFLSAFCHDRYIEQALAVEAAGYVTKTEPPESVIEAIRTVIGGATYYSPEVRSRIIIDGSQARLAAAPCTRASTLTPREREVLGYIARGLPKKQIAGLMHVSLSTVDAHAARLMGKLDIHDRVELALFAVREGLARA